MSRSCACHAEMQSRTLTEIQHQQEERKALEPVEEADLAVEVSASPGAESHPHPTSHT